MAQVECNKCVTILCLCVCTLLAVWCYVNIYSWLVARKCGKCTHKKIECGTASPVERTRCIIMLPLCVSVPMSLCVCILCNNAVLGAHKIYGWNPRLRKQKFTRHSQWRSKKCHFLTPKYSNKFFGTIYLMGKIKE